MVCVSAGMRGLCNGLGPALFGLFFWLSDVHLSGEGQATGLDSPMGAMPIGQPNNANINTTATEITITTKNVSLQYYYPYYFLKAELGLALPTQPTELPWWLSI